MPPSSTPPAGDGSQAGKTKRTSACLHCRRQKLKCDGGPDRTCTRCRDDGVECVVRPRANAAILADDLRWQQSVEMRIQALTREIEEVKSVNAGLVRQIRSEGSRSSRRSASPPPRILQHRGSSSTVSAPVITSPHAPLPKHLVGLRDVLSPALNALQHPSPLDVSIDDATLLWEYFYDSLAIFHGFTASTELATPSPLLFSAVVTASAKRFIGQMATPIERWEELFQRALVRLLYVVVPKTWDDCVALGIARTWFWKADEITAGLIYGSFVETITPNQNDLRDRRVWDFLEMTTVSHGILHLSTPIVPDQPPRGVPDRRPSHVLLMALNELFDSLGVVSRALTNPRSLVMMALTSQPSAKPLTFAEIVVLRNCRTDLERWCPKWLYEIQHADAATLPTGSGREFLVDLVTLYYHVALVVLDGYLNQAPQPENQRFEASARDLLNLAVTKWADSLHFWPKLFLHSSLIAALVPSPDDPLVRRAYDCFVTVSPMLQTSGTKLFHRLSERVQGANASALSIPVFTPQDVDIPIAMAYTGSDSFWADLSGVLGLPQPDLAGPIQVQPPQWPRDLSQWNPAGQVERVE